MAFMKKENGNIQSLNSFFGEGTFMKGILKFNGALRFDGKFEGEIITNDTFIIGKTGVINANISTGSLFNSGEVAGNVSAGQKIAIHSEGKLLGNIRTPILHIEEGAQFDGNCEMQRDGKERTAVLSQATSEKKKYIQSINKRRMKISAGILAGLLIILALYNLSISLNIIDKVKNLIKREDPVELMQKGLSLKDRGMTDEAIAVFTKLASLNSKDPEIHLSTAQAFAEMGLEDESISEYENAINLNPENLEPYYELLQLYTKKEMDDAAIATLKRIIDRDSKNLKMHFDLVALYEKKNMVDDAYNEYKNIVQLSPEHEDSLYNLGAISLSKGLEDEAAEMFKMAIKINDKNIEGHLNLANIYHKKGLEGEALSEYKRVEEIDTQHPEASNNRGFNAISLEKLDSAAAEFNKVIGVDEKNVRARLGLAIIHGRKGANDKAIQECKKAIEISPHHAPALNRLAWLYAKQNINIDEGIKLSREAIQINSNSPEYLDTLSELYYIKGEFDNAIETINKAIGLKPEDIYYKKQLKKFTAAKGLKK
jgi:tetratricopeptide (TPR) repeat protein